jgi:hypothetical protein
MYKFILLLIAPALLIPIGCKPHHEQPDNINVERGLRKNIPVLDRTISTQQLTAIGTAFRFMETEGRVPKTIEELEPYYENKKITQAVKDGAIVVILGVNPDSQPGEVVLAYTKEPDATDEHVALLCNLSTKVMTTKELDAAPKAKRR